MKDVLLLLLISVLFLIAFAGAAVFGKGKRVKWSILCVIVVMIAGILKLLMGVTHQNVGQLVLYNVLPLLAVIWICRIRVVSELLNRAAEAMMRHRELAEQRRGAKGK